MADPIHAQFRSARFRVTVLATLAVFAVLALAGWAVAVAHRDALRDNLEESLDRAADDMEDTLLGGGTLGAALLDDDAGFQVVAADGQVVAASPSLDGLAALPPPEGDDAEVRVVDDLPNDDDEAFLLRSEAIDGGLVVHVAAPLDDVEESAAELRSAFALAVPLTSAVLGVALWFLVGRLLRGAEEASIRQQRFVADASHELRSPLTRMRTELEVDLAHPDRAEPLATHRVVLDETIGLQHLVDDLLHLARVDDGAAPPPPTAVVDLDAVVERVAHDVRATGAVAVDTSAVGPVQVRGQVDQLRRAIGNLADNAARHAAATVRFEVAERAGQAVVAVTDDGPGIPPADRERVFERFSRLDEARSGASGGTGLGLAITREIVERHGGTVRVDPDHAPGARLVVSLPAT